MKKTFVAVLLVFTAVRALAAGDLTFIKGIQPYSVKMILSEMSREPSAEAFGAANGDCAGRAELCAFIDAARRYGLTYATDYALAGKAVEASDTKGNTIGIAKPKFWTDIELATYRHSAGKNDASYAIALLDVVDGLELNHYRRPQLLSQLATLLNSAKASADSATGMWKNAGELDATTSAMWVYAIMKATNRQYLSPEWKDYAKDIYKKYLKTFVTENSDGTITLTQCHELGFCPLGHDHNVTPNPVENGHSAVAAFIRASMECEASENVVYVFDGKCVANGKQTTVKVSKELAFSGADGGGKWTRGGKGGRTITVTTLEDNSEPGSLRYALEAEGPRTIEFTVSGEIHLKEPITVVNPYLTLSGQTAAKGITVMDHGILIKADEVIIRYMRFRMGETAGGSGSALECRSADNIIIDHCSISWGVNANLVIAAVSNATVSCCILSESLNCQKGDCGYGAIIGGRNVTVHHNLFASNNMGSPRLDNPIFYFGDDILYRRGTVEFVNNVVFNWGEKALWGGEEGWFNIRQNWFNAGSGTKAADARYIETTAATEISKISGTFFIASNLLDCSYVYEHGNYQGRKPDPKRLGILEELYRSISKAEPIKTADPYSPQSLEKLFKAVLSDVGASKPLDATDKRIIK
ncbi:MAG: glycoside hydrolase family 88 protein, partial [Bacteroidales bacterium]|nr:glycoside hydrolase family 88 protein [Bacteroidales bacterium]